MGAMTGLLAMMGFMLFLFIFVAKPKWDAYVRMGQLRPTERIVHEEEQVNIKWKAWATFPLYDWTYVEGGPTDHGKMTVHRLMLTNERILAIKCRVPMNIVDFTRAETLRSPWLAFKQFCLMNVARDNVRVTTDEAGNSCLEVLYEGRPGHGIRAWYYLRDLSAAEELFSDSLIAER